MVVVVIVCASLGHQSQLFEVIEDVCVQHIFSEFPVESFDVCVLSRLSWLDVMNFHTKGSEPLREHMSDELSSVVHSRALGQPAVA